MIALIGDVHGDFEALARIVRPIPAETLLIQVGDFGYWPGLEPAYMRQFAPLKRTVLFVDGNHDHIPEAQNCDWPGALFMWRGSVWLHDGKRILFCGGATSVDRDSRPHNSGPHAWFDDEVVTDADLDLCLASANAMKGVDILVTHSPPDWMIRKHFSPDGLRMFGHNPDTWVDHSARRIEALWNTLEQPQMYCGHMHRPVTDGKCRILDINEVVLV